MLPRPKLCFCGGSGEIFSAYFPNKIWSETVTRRAFATANEAEERAAAGRMTSPEAVTDSKAG